VGQAIPGEAGQLLPAIKHDLAGRRRSDADGWDSRRWGGKGPRDPLGRHAV
jgi:hypothetical protein